MDYKKLAGTSAVFVAADNQGTSPIERDGMVWSSVELQTRELPSESQAKPAIASPLALEGLEDYDPASHGDVRHVQSLGLDFIYNAPVKAWIQQVD